MEFAQIKFKVEEMDDKRIEKIKAMVPHASEGKMNRDNSEA